MNNMWHACHYCGPTDEELRPYGPGGSTVCFPCMKATPEREQASLGVYGALLDMTSSVGLTAIGTEAGPINVDAEDIANITAEYRTPAGPTGTPDPVATCGAFQPRVSRMKPYRCIEPHGHAGNHRAVIDGEVVAEWPRPGVPTEGADQ